MLAHDPGPRSAYLDGSRFVQRFGGSTTWSSTEMMRGISTSVMGRILEHVLVSPQTPRAAGETMPPRGGDREPRSGGRRPDGAPGAAPPGAAHRRRLVLRRPHGPGRLDTDQGIDIGPHPHTGLQTVTWLLAGELLHRDSLGSEQIIRPGQLNLMTAGHGVVHAEEATGVPGRAPRRPAVGGPARGDPPRRAGLRAPRRARRRSTWTAATATVLVGRARRRDLAGPPRHRPRRRRSRAAPGHDDRARSSRPTSTRSWCSTATVRVDGERRCRPGRLALPRLRSGRARGRRSSRHRA